MQPNYNYYLSLILFMLMALQSGCNSEAPIPSATSNSSEFPSEQPSSSSSNISPSEKPLPSSSEAPTEQPLVLLKIDPETYFQIRLALDDNIATFLEKQLHILDNHEIESPQYHEEMKAASDEFMIAQKALVEKYGITSTEIRLIEQDRGLSSQLSEFLKENPSIHEKLFNARQIKQKLMQKINEQRSIPIDQK